MKYSIIVTAHNEERYLKACLESIEKQKRDDLEMILIDDASSDETWSIFEEYAHKKQNVKLVHHDEAAGVAASRNQGIGMAQGEYIFFVDGDDMLVGQMIDKIDTVLLKNSVDLLHYNMLEYRAGEKRGLYFDSIEEKIYVEGDKKELIQRMFAIGKNQLYSANSYVYKRELIENMSFAELNIYDGLLFTLEALFKAHSVYMLNNYSYIYRKHIPSMTFKHYVPKCQPFICFCEKSERLFEKYPEFESLYILLCKMLFECDMISYMGKDSLIVYEYMCNPYPDSARENVRMLFENKAVVKLLNCLETVDYKDDVAGVYQKCKEQDEAWFHDWVMNFSLNREKALYEKYGYVHPAEYCVNFVKQAIYLVNPKVACSSLKAALSEYEYEDDYAVHKLQRHNTDMVPKNILSDLEKQFFIFTFVREPFHRLVSNYESKFKTDLRMGFNQYLTYRGGIMAKDEGFDVFVRRVCEIPDGYADRHFRSQYGLVYDKDGKQIPDFVGHLENIKEEYEEIRKKYRLNPLPVLNKTDKRDKKDWRSYYTIETANMVHERYKKDFEVFGYEKYYDELMEYLIKQEKGENEGV